MKNRVTEPRQKTKAAAKKAKPALNYHMASTRQMNDLVIARRRGGVKLLKPSPTRRYKK